MVSRVKGIKGANRVGGPMGKRGRRSQWGNGTMGSKGPIGLHGEMGFAGANGEMANGNKRGQPGCMGKCVNGIKGVIWVGWGNENVADENRGVGGKCEKVSVGLKVVKTKDPRNKEDGMRRTGDMMGSEFGKRIMLRR